jgi:hypothetical protein
MRKWLSGAAIIAVTAVGAYLVFASLAQKAPAPAPHADAPAAAPAPAPAQPVVLAEVVDVTDISPLLDPPTAPAEPVEPGPIITAVGMEPPARNNVQRASATTPIPRATE